MIESKVRNQYNQVAWIYDRRWNDYITRTLSFLKTWADLPPSAMVLDVACGTGEFERLILADHPTQQMVGVDYYEQRYQERVINNLQKKALALGFELTPQPQANTVS